MGKAIGAVVTVGSLFSKGFFKGKFSWAAAGFLLIDALLSRHHSQRPTLDVGVNTGEENEPLTRGWGTWRQAPSVLYWSSGFVPHGTHSSGGGKGGPPGEREDHLSCFYVGGRGPITRISQLSFNNDVVYECDNDGSNQRGLYFAQDSEDGHYYTTEGPDGSSGGVVNERQQIVYSDPLATSPTIELHIGGISATAVDLTNATGADGPDGVSIKHACERIFATPSSYVITTDVAPLGGGGWGGTVTVEFVNRLEGQNVAQMQSSDELGSVVITTLNSGISAIWAHLYDVGGFRIRYGIGTPNQAKDPLLVAGKGEARTPRFIGRTPRWWFLFEELDPSVTGGAVPNVTMRVVYESVAIADIILEMASWRNIPASRFDLSALAGMNVSGGFLLTSQQNISAAVKQLGEVHHFVLPEEDGVFRAKLKSATPVAALAENDFRWRVATGGGGASGGEVPELGFSDEGSIEAAPVVQLTFFDPNRNYHPGLRRGHRTANVPDAMRGKHDDLSVTMALPPAEAQQVAEIKAQENAMHAEAYDGALGLAHRWLAAGDVVNVAMNNNGGGSDTVRMWLQAVTWQNFGVGTVKLLRHENIYQPTALAPEVPGPLPSPSPDPLFFGGIVESNSLRDVDNPLGAYIYQAVPYANSTVDVAFSLARGYYRVVPPQGSTSTTLRFSATVGDAVDVLSDFASGDRRWDRVSTVTVDFWCGGDPESAAEVDVLNGANALIFGAPGRWEILQFANATFDAVNSTATRHRYVLDTFRRGMRGTEFAMGLHEAGDTVIVAAPGALLRAEFQAAQLGQALAGQFSVLRTGSVFREVDFILAGTSLIPWSVYDIEGERDGSNNLTISWRPRARSYSNFPGPDGTSTDLPERYEIEIAGTTRLISVAGTAGTESTIYTAAQQVADGLVPGDPVTLSIWEIGPTIGRGYMATATI